jgi:hypothetical protein
LTVIEEIRGLATDVGFRWKKSKQANAVNLTEQGDTLIEARVDPSRFSNASQL